MPGFDEQSFRRFGSGAYCCHAMEDPNMLARITDVVVHARERNDVGRNRNWSHDKWDMLCKCLSDKGYTIVAIGTAAYMPEHAVNCAGIDLKDTCTLLRQAKLAIGPSSGPMHLASLCGTPHVVWGEAGNIPRYDEHWNPHQAKNIYDASAEWNPDVSTVLNHALDMLSA